MTDKDLKTQLNILDNNRSRRRIGGVSCGFFIAFLLIFCTLFFVFPDKSFSENENRMLSSASSISASSLFEGTLPEKIRTVISDQFPFRSTFIGIESYLSLAFTGNANGVTLNKNASLSKEVTLRAESLEMLEASINAIKSLESTFCTQYKIKSSFAIVPLPCRAYQNRQSTCDLGFLTLEKELDINGMFSFANQAQSYDGIFYKTDHHLNADGTYLLYLFVCDQLGVEPMTDLTKVCVSESFYGTTWSQSGLWATPPDKIYKLSYEEENTYTVSGDITSESLYFSEKLETKDKYAYFLGGNYGRIEINSVSDIERTRLLIIKDSYANALIPLLVRHFDLTVIDPRYYKGNILSDAQNANSCLFLFGSSSLISDVGLAELNFNTENIKSADG